MKCLFIVLFITCSLAEHHLCFVGDSLYRGLMSNIYMVNTNANLTAHDYYKNTFRVQDSHIHYLMWECDKPTSTAKANIMIDRTHCDIIFLMCGAWLNIETPVSCYDYIHPFCPHYLDKIEPIVSKATVPIVLEYQAVCSIERCKSPGYLCPAHQHACLNRLRLEDPRFFFSEIIFNLSIRYLNYSCDGTHLLKRWSTECDVPDDVMRNIVNESLYFYRELAGVILE